jgi:hypothetical protein
MLREEGAAAPAMNMVPITPRTPNKDLITDYAPAQKRNSISILITLINCLNFHTPTLSMPLLCSHYPPQTNRSLPTS